MTIFSDTSGRPGNIEYRMLSCYLPLIINGDDSGLSESELDTFRRAFADVQHPVGHWSAESDAESFWGCCEVTGLWGDCVDVVWVDMTPVPASWSEVTA